MPVKLAASFQVDTLPGAEDSDCLLVLEAWKLDLEVVKGNASAIIQQPASRRDEVYDTYIRLSRAEVRLLLLQAIKFCAAEDITV